jgi:hypothetical protein
MTDIDRILQELAVADGWHAVCRCAEDLNQLTAAWPQFEQERAIERFVDGLRERNTFRYER